MTTMPTSNSLGLDFDELALQTAGEISVAPAEQTGPQPTTPKPEPSPREKRKPYINPDRVKTGGPQREKLTDEELAERMARMKEQNEKIKQRRIDVAADEAAFKQTQEVEHQKMERAKKIQDDVDKARERNSKRKMDKIQNREWDSGKPASADWKNQGKKLQPMRDIPASPFPQDSSQPTDAQSVPNAATDDSDQANLGNEIAKGQVFRGGRGRGRGGRGKGRVPSGEHPRLLFGISRHSGNEQIQIQDGEEPEDTASATYLAS